MHACGTWSLTTCTLQHSRARPWPRLWRDPVGMSGEGWLGLCWNVFKPYPHEFGFSWSLL